MKFATITSDITKAIKKLRNELRESKIAEFIPFFSERF